MPITSVITVKSSGGDYSSLATAEAGEQADLVSADVQMDIECYAMNDTSAVTISGWTTDATRYLRIYTPSSERHAGVWNTGKYRLTTASGSAITVNESYVRLEGLQVSTVTTGGTAVVGIGTSLGTSDVRVDSCILQGGAITLDVANDGTVAARNTILYGASSAAAATRSTSAALTLQNCTCIGNADNYGIRNVAGTITATNCYAMGFSGFSYAGTISKTTCASSDNTGSSGLTNIAHSTANFVNVSSGTEDYHLVSGSALIDAGTDLSATFTTDVDGNTRSGTWDIGADEFQGGGGGGFSAFLASVAQTQVIIGGGFYSF